MKPNDVLTQLRYEWTAVGFDAESRAIWRDIQQRNQLDFVPADSLGTLLKRLEPHGGLTVEERSMVIQVLLQEADHPAVHRALLQTLLPGLVSTCRQLQFGRGIIQRPSDVVNEAITMLSEILHEWAGQSRPYAAPDILSALRGRLRRWLLREKDYQQRIVGEKTVVAVEAESSHLLVRLNKLLEQPEYQDLAEVVYARVFQSVPLAELAKERHVAPITLQRSLQQFTMKHLL
jgi:hypothetical protein